MWLHGPTGPCGRWQRATWQALFQSGWPVVGLLTPTLVVHRVRTPKLAIVPGGCLLTTLMKRVSIKRFGWQ